MIQAEQIPTSAELDSFWGELVGSWRVDGDDEVVTFKKGKVSYTLKCGWNEGTLVVAMIAPWAREWDYVQLYRGRFGWGSVGRGFCTMKERRKAAKLLLDEIIRRNLWMQENPGALAEGKREIEDAAKEAKIPLWFAEYSWVRNKMAKAGDGDMRLYVKGGEPHLGNADPMRVGYRRLGKRQIALVSIAVAP